MRGRLEANGIEVKPFAACTGHICTATDANSPTRNGAGLAHNPRQSGHSQAASIAEIIAELETTRTPERAGRTMDHEAEDSFERLRVDVARLQDDIQRREPLVKQGAVGEEELKHLKAQLQAAQAAMSAADAAAQAASEQWQASRALVEGTSVAEHPQVLRAAAKLEEAFLQRQRLSVPTPIDGQVVRRTVQLGQRVAPGTPLMSVVSLDRVWVDANFKESQLAAIRIGQPVELFADVYGKDVVFHGKVEGLGAGTGAAFALLPAQNATGNWIKIVQRRQIQRQLVPKNNSQHSHEGASPSPDLRRDGAARQRSEQYFTFAQLRIHFFRQTKGRRHITQSLAGR